LSPQPSTRAVSLLVLVKVGSRQENGRNNGIAHFVEHLMFKGTPKRPNTLVISQELDAIGADYNAFTSKEKTGYYIKAESSNLPVIIDILADMIQNSIFDPKEVERERGTILEEINMYKDNPMAKIGDLFEEDLYGRGKPLGRHIIGTEELIKSMKQSQLIGFWREHYHSGNIVIAVAGNISNPKTIKLLEAAFGKIRKGKRNVISRAHGFSRGNLLNAHYKDTSQAHLILGFPGIHADHKDRFALGLLSVILGGNMSSRLFISVRERLGLCYFIRSDVDTLEDVGSFLIQAGLDLTKLDKALQAVSGELKDIKTNGATAEELNKAKQFIKGKMALSQEDSLDVAQFYSSQLLFKKKILTPEQVFAQVDKVTQKDIARVARAILQPKKARLTTLSPFKSIKKFGKFLDF